MITNTYLIGKHLKFPQYDIEIKKCCMCGNSGVGFKSKNIISSNFMDNDYLNESDEICVYCAVCLGKGLSQNEQIRLFSFIATESKLQFLKREDIWGNIFLPPDEPFVFCVTYSHKKHISFKSSVCQPGNRYQIQTDNSRVDIDIEKINQVSQVIQKWYSICKDTKQEPTWFTKDEIKYGCTNFKRIEEYGINNYIEENKVIEPFRNTSLLELLCYAVNKGVISENDIDKISISNFISEYTENNKPKQLSLF